MRAFVVSRQANVPAPLVRLTGYNGARDPRHDRHGGPATLPVVSGATYPTASAITKPRASTSSCPRPGCAAACRYGSKSIRCGSSARRWWSTPPRRWEVRRANGNRAGAVGIGRVRAGRADGGNGAGRGHAPLSDSARQYQRHHAAAYTLTSVADGLDTQTEWSNALVELNQLRSMEVESQHDAFLLRSRASIRRQHRRHRLRTGQVGNRLGLCRSVAAHDVARARSQPQPSARAVRSRGQSRSELSVRRRRSRCDIR